MKQVYRLESFADIQKAFNGTRMEGDPIPMVEQKAILHIEGESLMLLDSERFVLSEPLAIPT